MSARKPWEKFPSRPAQAFLKCVKLSARAFAIRRRRHITEDVYRDSCILLWKGHIGHGTLQHTIACQRKLDDRSIYISLPWQVIWLLWPCHRLPLLTPIDAFCPCRIWELPEFTNDLLQCTFDIHSLDHSLCQETHIVSSLTRMPSIAGLDIVQYVRIVARLSTGGLSGCSRI